MTVYPSFRPWHAPRNAGQPSWRAVQEAAWRALQTPFAQDCSLTEETPR